ncbi:MAG: Holliday junction branch migration protein RuvA [Candidatus Saccharimonadales bacterium]
MIATLEGLISEKMLDIVVIDVNGVGYSLNVTSEDHSRLFTGQKSRLYIYEHIREQAHDLYGFVSFETKQLFEQLLSVKNVGPKVAMAVLDIGSAIKVREALASGDVKLLQSAKGVGKRAAEQMVVELRDKVGQLVSESAENIVNRAGIDNQDEAVEALTSLGYSPQDAVAALHQVDPSLSTEERIRQALKG